MKKITFVLALLLVFSIFYSCAKNNEEPISDSSEASIEETTEPEDTSIRISQSTLPPLQTDGGDEGGGQGPAQTASPMPSGSSNWFNYETNTATGGNLAVGEDSGFGGEAGIVK